MPHKATDYLKTVIYKIVCNDRNITDLYVGHTTDFTTRKSTHKSHCNNDWDPKHHLKIYQIIRANGGWGNWDMFEIEKYPCEDGNEARTRERYWYEGLNANMNHLLPINTEADLKIAKQRHDTTYRNKEENKARQSQYMKDYRTIQENKDKKKVRVQCLCGSIVCKNDVSRHKKTNKHQSYLAEQGENPTV